MEQIKSYMELFVESMSEGNRVAAQGFLIEIERLAEQGNKSGQLTGSQYIEVMNVQLPMLWHQFYAAE
jgi:hypothetical protein